MCGFDHINAVAGTRLPDSALEIPYVCTRARRAGKLSQITSDELKRAFEQPGSADELEALADAFPAAIRAGDYKAKGWSSSMYGVSKALEISYTLRLLATDVKRKVRARLN